MGNIKEVVRDIRNNVILVATAWQGQNNFFYWQEGKIRNFGAWLPAESKEMKQIRAIFYERRVTAPNEGKEEIKKDKRIDKPGSMRPIKQHLLSKIEKDRLSALRQAGIYYLPLGWIRVNRWQKKKGKITNHPLHAPDIDTAIRMESHTLSGYDEPAGEIKKLNDFDEIIRSANRLFEFWKQAGKLDKKIIEQKLLWLVYQLEKCRNDYKIAAREQVKKASLITDSLGRENPSALAARTVAAFNNLARRFGEIRVIAPKIALRRELLNFVKEFFAMQARQANILLKSILGRSLENIAANKKDINRIIGRSLYLTSILWVSPYYERGKEGDTYLKQAKKKLYGNNIKETVKNLIFAIHRLGGGLPLRT